MITSCKCGIMIWVHLGCPVCPKTKGDEEE